jgi:hypothetical protein
VFLFLVSTLASPASFALAGSVFVTGHDPDFHAYLGANALGAQHINQVGIGFIMDPAFNPYVMGGATKFLFVESNISPPGGHVEGKLGVVASGYVEGTDFEKHDAYTLDGELNMLGTKYGGIVIASDFGGILTQAELGILNARRADIIAFLNSGGGLYGMAESNNGAHLTPLGGQWDFLPEVVSSVPLDQYEVGNTVTPFGASLGLTDADVNSNASHNVFDVVPTGWEVVDNDAAGRHLTLACRCVVTPVEPSTWGTIKSLYR